MLSLIFLLASLNFVDTPIQEVVRSISLAYNTPILVDGNLDKRVTFHLEGVGVLEGLTAFCEANGLELVQSGDVFHVRPVQRRGVHEFLQEDSLVSITVKDKEIADFIQEFGKNTGMNVLGAPGLSGVIQGSLQHVKPEEALRLLMNANGFRLVRDGSAFRIEERGASHGDGRESAEVPQGGVQILQEEDLFSVEANEASLVEVLQELSRTAKLDLALYGDIQEKVRLRLEKVSLENLLEALFRGRQYGFVRNGRSLYVAESGSRKALAQTTFFPLRHIHSERALGYLSKLPPSANFAVIEVKEQNGLLLSGSGAEIQMAQELLGQVDVPPLQVMLSCLILEFKHGKNFEIGLHSGNGRKTGEKDVGIRGFLDFSKVGLTKSGSFGKVGLLPDRFEMELASMEENNLVEVLARPQLSTINGNKAELNVTNTVYYLVSQVSADGYPITDYRSFNDGISLEITPTVTLDGSITLDVSPEIKTAGRSSGDGPRDISSRNLKTVVVLRDGETFCLGGLIRKNKSEVRSAVPFLGSLPLVGRFFSYTSEEDENSELAIFITPKVDWSLKKNPGAAR